MAHRRAGSMGCMEAVITAAVVLLLALEVLMVRGTWQRPPQGTLNLTGPRGDRGQTAPRSASAVTVAPAPRPWLASRVISPDWVEAGKTTGLASEVAGVLWLHNGDPYSHNSAPVVYQRRTIPPGKFDLELQVRETGHLMGYRGGNCGLGIAEVADNPRLELYPLANAATPANGFYLEMALREPSGDQLAPWRLRKMQDGQVIAIHRFGHAIPDEAFHTIRIAVRREHISVGVDRSIQTEAAFSVPLHLPRRLWLDTTYGNLCVRSLRLMPRR